MAGFYETIFRVARLFEQYHLAAYFAQFINWFIYIHVYIYIHIYNRIDFLLSWVYLFELMIDN